MKSIEYLAGLFDGEGSFSIQVSLRYYKDGSPSGFVNPSMSVNPYYGDAVLDHFVEAFGGKIYTYKRGGRRWHLGAREAVRAAAFALEPHLEIKRDIAHRFIQALDLFPSVGSGANRRAGERVWSPQQVIDVAEIALTLNPARSRRCNKTVEYITELKGALS